MGVRRRELWILVAIAAAFAVLALPREPRLAAPLLPALPSAGSRIAPPFELPLAQGGSASLDDYAGEVVLVNFWATWCQPCRAELPALEALQAELAGEGLRILAVSVDAASAEAVARFAAERGLRLPVLHDPSEAVARRYGAFAYPTSVVVDRAGRIVLTAPGAFAWDAPESIAWFRALLVVGDGVN
jgi:peroxiredoxin